MNNNTHSKHAKWMRIGMYAYLFPQYYKFRRKVIELAEITCDADILDFGCGIGLLEESIITEELNFGKIIGVDIGTELINIAKSNFNRCSNIEFYVIDGTGKLPFDNDSFDIVVSNFVFHLLDKDNKIRALKEIFRVLKPGGHVLFAEIGKPYNLIGYWVKFLALHVWNKIWDYENNSVDSFKGLFPGYISSSGFRDIKIIYRMKGFIEFLFCKK